MLHWRYFVLDNVQYKSVETFSNFSTMKIFFIFAVYLLAGVLAFDDASKLIKRKRSKRDLIYWNRHSNSVLKYTYKRNIQAIENKTDANDIMEQIRRHLMLINNNQQTSEKSTKPRENP